MAAVQMSGLTPEAPKTLTGGQTMEDRFLRFREVQDLLSVSRSTLWRWIAERGLKSLRVGGVVRIRQSDLQAFLKRHEGCGQPVLPQASAGVIQPA